MPLSYLGPFKIDKNRLRVMKDFLQWMSTDCQKLTQELLYVPLPEEVGARAGRFQQDPMRWSVPRGQL